MVLGLFRKKVVLTRKEASVAKSGKKKTRKKAASASKRKKTAHANDGKKSVRKKAVARKKKTKKKTARARGKKLANAGKKTAHANDGKKSVRKKAVRKTSQKRTGFIEVGRITHYFPRVKAGVVKITKGTIALGDMLYFKGHTSDFKQKIASMQIFGRAVKTANKGKEIGLRLRLRVREGDLVYKIKV